MRLRNVKGSREAIVDSLYTINEPAFMKGKWAEHFGNNHPIHIEVGMGKGRFITDLARQNPDINYVGIEKYSSVLIRAIEKLEQLNSNSEMPVKNLIFIRMNAENLCDVFEKNEVSRIYINFSDPWPKDRHGGLLPKNFLPGMTRFLSRTVRWNSKPITVIYLIFRWNRFRLPAGNYPPAHLTCTMMM